MTIEERVKKLEGELTAAKRRNRWMLGGAALLLLGCLTIAATPGDQKIIRAQQFIVVNDQGRECAMLGVSQDLPYLGMFDANDKCRIVLNVSPVGPELHILDENNKNRVILGMGTNGPALCMLDAKDKTRVVLNVSPPVGPQLTLSDENSPRASLFVDKDGPRLALLDTNHKPRAILGLGKDRPVLVLSDENGKTIWQAP